jgi:ribosome-associated protein
MPPNSPERPPQPDEPTLGAGAVELAPGVTLPAAALDFAATRASGPGGQNVNRRATKVELRVFLDALPLDDHAKRRLRRLAGRRLTSDGELIIVAQAGRTQGTNRRRCLQELSDLVREARRRPKVRKKTAPTRGSRERRLRDKKQRGERKAQRQASKRAGEHDP